MRRWAVAHLDLLPWSIVGGVVLVSAALMLAGHWTATGDDAMVAAFTADVGTSHHPMLGMPTSLSFQTGDPLRHPGPLQFWFLAPTSRVLGVHGVGAGTAAIQVLMIGVAARSARHIRPRAVGPGLAVVMLLLLTRGLGDTGTVSPFNPHLLVAAGFATFVALWALLAGDRWSLLGLVAAGSLAAQVHVTGLPVVGVVVLVAVAALVADLCRRPADDPVRRHTLRRVVPAAVAVGLACWSGPLWDLAFGTGNLWGLITNGTGEAPAGLGVALDRLTSALSFPVLWLRSVETVSWDPSTFDRLFAIAVLALLVLGVRRGLRERRRGLVAAGVAALTALAGATAMTSRLPDEAMPLRSVSNGEIWWPVSAVAWAAAATVGGVLLAPTVARWGDRPAWAHAPRRLRASGRVALVVAILAVVVVGGRFVRSVDAADTRGSLGWGATRHHTSAIAVRVPPGGTVRLQVPSLDPASYELTQSLIGRLRVLDREVQVDAPDRSGLFTAYRAEHPTTTEPDLVVYVRATIDVPEPPPGATRLSVWNPREPTEALASYTRPTAFGVGGRVSSLWILPPAP